MKILKTILAMVVMFLSIYSLMTGKYGIFPYTLLFMGLLLFVMGVTKIQEQGKRMAIFLFLSSGFVLFVSIEGLLS